jgi:hypothetical protein
MSVMQGQKGQVLLPGSEAIGRDQAEKAKDIGTCTEGRAGPGSGREVGQSLGGDSRRDSATEHLAERLLVFQDQTALATSLLAQWARPMTNYLGRITHALEARNEVECSGSGVSGSGLGKKK